jgi:hypothetical protein
VHAVEIPTSPTRAAQRLPLHRMRWWSSSTYSWGIRARSASLSKAKRGHSDENEQHAPQVRHAEVVSSTECVGITQYGFGVDRRLHITSSSHVTTASNRSSPSATRSTINPPNGRVCGPSHNPWYSTHTTTLNEIASELPLAFRCCRAHIAFHAHSFRSNRFFGRCEDSCIPSKTMEMGDLSSRSGKPSGVFIGLL